MISSGSLTFGTVAATLFVSPPGPCSVTLTCTAGTALIGFGGTGVVAGTAPNGFPLPAPLQTPFSLRAGDPPTIISAISAGSPCTMTWIISSFQ